jgi:hypothetical protein
MPHSRLLTALCIDLVREFPVTEFEGYLVITKFKYYKPGYNLINLKYFHYLHMQCW